jgi:hypothetical protein
MSDMMGGAPAPQQGVESKMSVFNPTDMASKVTKGDIRPQQTVGEFLQRNFGVTPQDPVEKLFANIKGQAKNATVAGKMGAPTPPAPGQPQMPQRPPVRSLDDLTQRM